MTPEQERHLTGLSHELSRRLWEKYRKGAAEHGGCLKDMATVDLLDNAIDETVDQATYLLTLRARLADDYVSTHQGLNQCSARAPTKWLVETESKRAEAEHGPLTGDHFRAFTVLSEEVGEVATCLLELGRAQRRFGNGGSAESVAAARKAVGELIQVISVASKMVENLQKEVEEWTRTKTPSA